MKINSLHIKKYENIDNQTFDMSAHDGLSLLIGNNGCGKSNVLECISSIFNGLYQNSDSFETDFAIQYQLYNDSVVDIKC